MASRTGFTADGKHFCDCLSASMRGTPLHRYFIDGKVVAKATWREEAAKARAADRAKANDGLTASNTVV